MTLTKELIALITEKVGRFNTDILSGWEAGLMGKERIGRKLFDRCAPEHLTGQRFADWNIGRDAACRYKKSLVRQTYFTGKGPHGEIKIVRAGWVSRGKVVTQMERAGAYGDVFVSYTEGGEVKRTVVCGI